MTDERDDEILGRALARAIETQEPNETPYERSRLVVRPLRRGLPLFQFAGIAAVLLLAVAFSSWLLRPATSTPAAASVAPSPTQAATAPAAATASPQVDVGRRTWAYFTREGLPPVGAFITAHGPDDTADHRVLTNLSSLGSVARAETPAGVTNPLAQAGAYAGGRSFAVGVRLDGDLATIELDAPNGWGIRDPYTNQLIQQVVYTATEEPAVRRVRFAGRGGTVLKIDQLVFDKVLTRDDVSGYTTRAQTGTTSFEGDTTTQYLTGDLLKREIVDGTLVRLTFVGSDRAHNAAKANLPPFTISFRPNDGSVPHNRNDGAPPAYLLGISFQFNGTGQMGAVGMTERVDRSPLRYVERSDLFYELGLDDARPWRAYQPDPQHLVVEVGGDPRLVSDRVAISEPTPLAGIDTRASRTFTLSGVARAFEANVVWRVITGPLKKVAVSGHTTASIGTSALWGTFSTQVTLPASMSGDVVLEIYEVSPKDGTEQGIVSIPLVVR